MNAQPENPVAKDAYAYILRTSLGLEGNETQIAFKGLATPIHPSMTLVPILKMCKWDEVAEKNSFYPISFDQAISLIQLCNMDDEVFCFDRDDGCITVNMNIINSNGAWTRDEVKSFCTITEVINNELVLKYVEIPQPLVSFSQLKSEMVEENYFHDGSMIACEILVTNGSRFAGTSFCGNMEKQDVELGRKKAFDRAADDWYTAAFYSARSINFINTLPRLLDKDVIAVTLCSPL